MPAPVFYVGVLISICIHWYFLFDIPENNSSSERATPQSGNVRTKQLLLLSFTTTAIAAFLGFIGLAIIYGPFAIFLFMTPMGLAVLFGRALYSLPVTLLLFPILAKVLRRYSVSPTIIVPLAGLVAGGILMRIAEIIKADTNFHFTIMGSVIGFVSGVFYTYGIHPRLNP